MRKTGARWRREERAEVVFVRATINSAGNVLPPKTYRNKYAVRPVRGWAAALYSNAVHMEQFITLQRCRETEGGRERERERERESPPRFSTTIRAACVFSCSPAIVHVLLNYYFAICVLFLAMTVRLDAHVTIGKTGYEWKWWLDRRRKNKKSTLYIYIE